MRLRKLIAAAGIATAVAGLGLVSAGEASAYTADCDGETHAVCLYYNSAANGYGAVFKQVGDIANYAPYAFAAGKNGTAGAGVSVLNHVAVVDNWSSSSFTLYYSSGYNCSVTCLSVPAWSLVDLGSTKSLSASGKFN